MFKPAARDALLFQEPACPICFEPFSTEAPDDPEDEDHRPALICGRPSVCACCYVSQSTRAGQRHTHGLQIDYSLMSSIVLLQHVQHALPSLHQQAEVRRLAQTLAHNHSNSQQNNLRQFAAELDTLEEVSSMHSSVSSAGSAPMMFEFSNPAEFANAGRSANPTADACCHAQ